MGLDKNEFPLNPWKFENCAHFVSCRPKFLPGPPPSAWALPLPSASLRLPRHFVSRHLTLRPTATNRTRSWRALASKPSKPPKTLASAGAATGRPPSLPPSLPHSDPYPRSTLNPTPSPAAAAAGAGKKKCRARSSRSRWGNAGTRSGWSSGSSYASSMASARTASSRTSPLRYVPHAPHSPFSPVPVSVTCPSPPLLTRWPRLSRLMAVSGLLEISAAGALICDVCGYGGEAR